MINLVIIPIRNLIMTTIIIPIANLILIMIPTPHLAVIKNRIMKIPVVMIFLKSLQMNFQVHFRPIITLKILLRPRQKTVTIIPIINLVRLMILS